MQSNQVTNQEAKINSITFPSFISNQNNQTASEINLSKANPPPQEKIHLSIKVNQKMQDSNKKENPEEKKSKKNASESSEEGTPESNLMFSQKDISPLKLYCHLSEKFEVILMILGVIGSLGKGSAGPIMALLFGDMINTFSGTDPSKLETLPPEQLSIFMSLFKEEISKLVKKLLYIGVGMFFAGFLSNFMWSYSGLRQMLHLKEKYFATILKQEQGWFDANNAYEFSTKVQAQLEQIELGVGIKFGLILQSFAELIAGLIIAFTTSWNMTLIMLCVTPGIMGCAIFLVKGLKWPIVMGRKTWEQAGGIAEELIYNIKTVTSFSNYEYEIDRFSKKVDKVHEFNKQKSLRYGIAIGGVIFFVNFTFFIAIMYGKKLISDQSWNSCKGRPFSPGDVMTVIFSTLLAIMSLGNVSPNIKIIQEAASASSDYFTLYERKPLIDLSESDYIPKREEVKGKIEFKDISFIYPSDIQKRKILNGLSLIIQPGQKVALVGESGCGKSTTINLLERLYEPESGQVLLDDIDIKKYEINHLRNLIGYVQQEPVLFNRSIKENLIFGREQLIKELNENNEDPEKLIKEACDDSYATEFINKNQEKFEYIVGIKGSKLSGGQKQRLAIARAILCKPKILILDEATSALDNKSEKEVQAALDNISKKNVTTLIIAHRLSTIKNADVIYALKNGQVQEFGTHQELLKKNGYYASLVKAQINQENLESKEENAFDNKILKKISSIKNKRLSSKLQSDLEKQQLNDIQRENIDLLEKETKIEHGKIFALLKNNKANAFFGSLGAFFCGAILPVTGFILSKAITCLSNADLNYVKDKGLYWALAFLGLAILNGLFIFVKIWKLETIGSFISNELRKKIITKYLNLHIGYFDYDENSPGSLLTKLSIDTTQINSLILTIIGDIVQCSGALIVGLLIGFIFDYRITLINLAFLPFIVFSQVVVLRARKGARNTDKKIDIESGSVLSECVINTKTIFSFNFQQKAVDMYLKILYDGTNNFLKDSLFRGFFLGLGSFCVYASNATKYHFAGEWITGGSLTYQNMNASMNSSSTMTMAISTGLTGIADYGKAKKAFQSIFRVLNTKTKIEPFLEENIKRGSINIPEGEELKGKIEFRNVTFSYPTKPGKRILKNVSFTIQPGHSAALVGYSGCGKSTIIQLLERYYDVDEGQILIDGIDIRNYNLYQLRHCIGLVSQEPVLFKRSVYENILYGKLNANKDEVFHAAKKAKIEKFFNQENMGTKEDPVSGGEKQRLAIARAFLKNPAVLLLDEATSALDKESEIEVQKSINELQKGRTSVSIAHRLSTIVDSDVIFVMENGKIVEKGNHKELMQLGKKYADLYRYSSMN